MAVHVHSREVVVVVRAVRFVWCEENKGEGGVLISTTSCGQRDIVERDVELRLQYCNIHIAKKVVPLVPLVPWCRAPSRRQLQGGGGGGGEGGGKEPTPPRRQRALTPPCGVLWPPSSFSAARTAGVMAWSTRYW